MLTKISQRRKRWQHKSKRKGNTQRYMLGQCVKQCQNATHCNSLTATEPIMTQRHEQHQKRFGLGAKNSVTLAKAAWSHTEDKSTGWTECLGSLGAFSLAPPTFLNCIAQIRKVSPTKGRPFSSSRNSKDPRHLSFASVP